MLSTQKVAALRKQLLQALVIGLGVAAVTGGLAIFTRAGWVIGRIGGTAAVLALATAFSLTVIGKLENPRTVRAASAGMWVIAVSAFMFLVAVWAPMLGVSDEGRLWITAVIFAACGGIGAAVLQALAEPWSRVAAATALLMDGAVLVLGLAAVWEVGGQTLQDQLGESAVWTACMLPVICLPLVGAFADRRHWRWIGFAAGVAGLGLLMHRVWTIPPRSYHTEPSWAIQLIVIGSVVAHAVVMDRVPLKEGRRWIALVAIVCTVVVGILMSLVNWKTGWERAGSDDVYLRAMMAMSFVGACATLAVPAVYGMERRRSVLQGSAPMSEVTAISLSCPHCHAKQDAPVGTSRCVGCGLMMTLAVAEPRCESCGYSLLDIKGEVCPECGMKAPAKGVALVLGEAEKK
jgi:hypothetical protein